jgi:hypothetical protein
MGHYEVIGGEGRLLAHQQHGKTHVMAEFVPCTRKEAPPCAKYVIGRLMSKFITIWPIFDEAVGHQKSIVTAGSDAVPIFMKIEKRFSSRKLPGFTEIDYL